RGTKHRGNLLRSPSVFCKGSTCPRFIPPCRDQISLLILGYTGQPAVFSSVLRDSTICSQLAACISERWCVAYPLRSIKHQLIYFFIVLRCVPTHDTSSPRLAHKVVM